MIKAHAIYSAGSNASVYLSCKSYALATPSQMIQSYTSFSNQTSTHLHHQLHQSNGTPSYLSSYPMTPAPQSSPIRLLLRRRQRLGIPNLLRVLLDAAITAKEPHSCYTSNALLQPSILVLVRLINQLMRLNITVKVIGHEIVIAVLGDRVTQGGEAGCVAEFVGANGGEDLG